MVNPADRVLHRFRELVVLSPHLAHHCRFVGRVALVGVVSGSRTNGLSPGG